MDDRRFYSFGFLVVGVGCHAQQSTDPTDATRAERDASVSASASATVTATATGDARTQCADAANEQKFLQTHKRCSVDQDCTLADTWLYPCGMPIQKSAVADLKVVDRSVSLACTKLGFRAPERDCTAAVLRSGCSGGVCVNVVPFPLQEGR